MGTTTAAVLRTSAVRDVQRGYGRVASIGRRVGEPVAGAGRPDGRQCAGCGCCGSTSLTVLTIFGGGVVDDILDAVFVWLVIGDDDAVAFARAVLRACDSLAIRRRGRRRRRVKCVVFGGDRLRRKLNRVWSIGQLHADDVVNSSTVDRPKTYQSTYTGVNLYGGLASSSASQQSNQV